MIVSVQISSRHILNYTLRLIDYFLVQKLTQSRLKLMSYRILMRLLLMTILAEYCQITAFSKKIGVQAKISIEMLKSILTDNSFMCIINLRLSVYNSDSF